MSKLANENLNINTSSDPISQHSKLAIIAKNVKSSSQSGVKNISSYSVYFTDKSFTNKNINNFMSWICNASSLNSVQLTFATLENAIKYCNEKSCKYLVLQDGKNSNKLIKPKSYTQNFTN